MVHTLTLFQKISYEQNQILWNNYTVEQRPDKHYKNVKHYEIKDLSCYGITFELIHSQKYHDGRKIWDSFYIHLRLNPSKILGGNCLSIFTPDNYTPMKNAYEARTVDFFNDFKELQQLTVLEQWKVQRIDYVVQLRVSDAQKYVALMQRGGLPRRGNFFIKYDEKANKKNHRANDYEKHQDGSVYLTGGKRATRTEPFKRGSYNINFYDKRSEMQHTNEEEKNNGRPPKYTEEQLEEATNILRLEVQTLPSKVNRIASKYGFTTKSMDKYLLLNIAREIISTMYKDIAGTCDYIKKKDAVKLIDASGRKQPVKNRLIELLDYMTGGGGQGRSLWKYQREIHGKEAERKALYRDIGRLEDLGINIVPLNSEYKMDVLPNLYGQIQQYFEDTKMQLISDDVGEQDDFWCDNEE